MKEMSGGHVILIVCDCTGDCSIMNGDVPRGLEMDLSVMDMTATAYAIWNVSTSLIL